MRVVRREFFGGLRTSGFPLLRLTRMFRAAGMDGLASVRGPAIASGGVWMEEMT